LNRYKCQPIGQTSIERIGSGGTVLHFEFPKFIHVPLRSKYSHNSTSKKMLFLFTTGVMKQIELDLVFERPHIYKLHTICYRTRLVYHMDEFWTIIDRDCANKSTADRIFCVFRILEGNCLCQLQYSELGNK
jgi:hypothetical protein